MSLKDALGNPVCRGWAIQVDAMRGSADIRRVFVLGLNKTGKQALILGSSLTNPDEVEAAVEEYDLGNDEVPTYTKTQTRLVMTGDRL